VERSGLHGFLHLGLGITQQHPNNKHLEYEAVVGKRVFNHRTVWVHVTVQLPKEDRVPEPLPTT
jgi:hypothetical protein